MASGFLHAVILKAHLTLPARLGDELRPRLFPLCYKEVGRKGQILSQNLKCSNSEPRGRRRSLNLIGISKDVVLGGCARLIRPFCVGYRHESPSLFLKCKQLENFPQPLFMKKTVL